MIVDILFYFGANVISILIAALGAFIPAYIGQNRGRSFWACFFCGMLISPLLVSFVLYLMPDKSKEDDKLAEIANKEEEDILVKPSGFKLDIIKEDKKVEEVKTEEEVGLEEEISEEEPLEETSSETEAVTEKTEESILMPEEEQAENEVEEISKPEKKVKVRYCSRCGGLIDNGTKICTGCGKKYFKLNIKINKTTLTVASLVLLLIVSLVFNIVSLSSANKSSAPVDIFVNRFINELDTEIERCSIEEKEYKNAGNYQKAKEAEEKKKELKAFKKENKKKFKICVKEVLETDEFKNINLQSDKELQLAELAINYEFGGAEYALSKEDKDIYEEAKKYNEENGISYEVYYEYLYKLMQIEKENEEKTPLTISETNELMLNWFFEEVQNGRIKLGEANALASLELKKSFNNTTSYDYDLSSEENAYISSLSATEQEKYKYFKENVPEGFSMEKFQKFLGAYKSKSKKNERIEALMQAGLSYTAATEFYKVMQSTTGYKTTAAPQTIRKKYRINSECSNELYDDFIEIQHADAATLEKERKKYIKGQLERLPQWWHELYDINEATEDIYRILSE